MSRSNALRRDPPQAATASDPSTSEQADEFAAALTELSMKHGIAITGAPVLFVMEQEDFGAAYRVDKESNLSFG